MYVAAFLAMFMVLTGALHQLPVAKDAPELPVPVKTVRPPYPALAVANKISGAVLVDVRVGSEGTVTDANIVMGPEILANPAKAAARFWRFKSRPTDSGSYVVRLTFIFHDRAYVEPEKKPDFTSPYQMELTPPKQEF